MERHDDSRLHQQCACGTAHLTTREAQILLLVAAGYGSRAIGHKLGISPRTVEDHLAVMRKHAAARDSAELVARCYAAEVYRLLKPRPTGSGHRPGAFKNPFKNQRVQQPRQSRLLRTSAA